MTITVSKRRAVWYTIGVTLISSILTFAVGTAYLDARIERGIENSKVIDLRVDQAFRGVCEILVISSKPRPKPPTPEGSNLPDPTSPYGRALAQYNRELARQQTEGLAAVNAAIETYHCRR